MKEKKPKIKKIKEPRVKKSGRSLLFTGLSLILTIVMFVGLIFLQDYLSEKITYKQVVVAKRDIPDNEVITEENIEKYFTVKSINILDTTAGALTDTNILLGKRAIVPLYEGEAVSEKDFENISVYTKDIKNPIEVSIKIADIANADGGKIRKGDLVNLTMMFTRAQLGTASGSSVNSLNIPISSENSSGLFDAFTENSSADLNLTNTEATDIEVTDAEITEESTSENDFLETSLEEEVTEIKEEQTVVEETVEKIHDEKNYVYDFLSQYVLENLYVEKVLDSSGIEIAPTDTESSASIIIFTIDKENEAELNNALSNCSSLRISKIINK